MALGSDSIENMDILFTMLSPTKLINFFFSFVYCLDKSNFLINSFE